MSSAEEVKLARPSRLVNARKTNAATRKLIAQSASGSRFLQLPPEIRNRIYRFALGGQVIHVNNTYGSHNGKLNVKVCKSPEDVETTAKEYASDDYMTAFHKQHRACTWKSTHSDPDRGLSLQLLRVSRLIYNEAALVVFASNTWYINANRGALQEFMAKLMPCQKRAIQRLELYCPLDWSYDILPKAGLGIGRSLVGLRRLRVQVVLERWLLPTEKKDLEKLSKTLGEFAQGQLDVVKLSVTRTKGKVSTEIQKQFADLEDHMRLSKAEHEEYRARAKEAKAESREQAREELREKEEAQAREVAERQEAHTASRNTARVQRGLRSLKKA